MSRYWYDLEFIEDGKTIELISIGIVASDGREYYAVVDDGDWDRVLLSPWLLANVVPHLPLVRPDVLAHYLAGHPGTTLDHVRRFATLDGLNPAVKPRLEVANEVREFLRVGEGEFELWADFSAYDHVALCQLWGPMVALPRGIPMWTNDIQQEAARLGLRDQLPQQCYGLHNALDDARMCRELWQWLQRQVAVVALAADLRTQWAEVEQAEPDGSETRPCSNVPCPPFEEVTFTLTPAETDVSVEECVSTLCPPTPCPPATTDREQSSDDPAWCPYDCDSCHAHDDCLCPNCTRTRDHIAREEEDLS